MANDGGFVVVLLLIVILVEVVEWCWSCICAGGVGGCSVGDGGARACGAVLNVVVVGRFICL